MDGVSPANAHIAAADVQIASEWGTPVSVWPLDAGLHYAWLRQDLRWWDDSWATPQGSRGPLFWRSEQRFGEFLAREVRVDSGLEAVLARGGELMFTTAPLCDAASRGWFVSVPLQLEPQLLRLLDVTPFSSAARVVQGAQMRTEGTVKRKYFIAPSER